MNIKREFRLLILMALMPLLGLACAGPVTPFGAIHLPPQKKAKPKEIESSYDKLISIQFNPQKQVLHGSEDFEIIIKDSAGLETNDSIKVYFNGVDITSSFFYRAEVFTDPSQTELKVRFKNLQLRPDQRNDIMVRYKNQLGIVRTQRFESPYCPLTNLWNIENVRPFQPRDKIIQLVQDRSSEEGLNPSLIVALIAQESGFYSKALSWARALGLTQITPLAERDIASSHPEFKRYPDINDMSFLELKAKILSGKINSKNEWRLDPKSSIIGGISFLKRLDEYWRRKETDELLRKNFANPEKARLDAILASYNSGASRVRRAIKKHGKDYLFASKELNAAREYVHKIQSYCFHFSDISKTKD